MRTVTITAMMIALGIGAAHAQQKTPMDLLDDAKKREAADIDRQYKAAPGRAKAPAPAAKPDPWGNIRSANPPPPSDKR